VSRIEKGRFFVPQNVPNSKIEQPLLLLLLVGTREQQAAATAAAAVYGGNPGERV